MPTSKRATTRTGLTLKTLQGSVEAKAIVEHQLIIIHQKCMDNKSYEADFTKILQKEVNLTYTSALWLKKAMMENKTIIPVSRSGIRFRVGIAKPNQGMVSYAIQKALQMLNVSTNTPSKTETVPVNKPLSSYSSKELVEELRNRGITIKAYIEL